MFGFSIGFAIAKRLGAEGASVVISSRKEKNVSEALAKLKAEGITVAGTVCHVAKAEDRVRLLKTVSTVTYFLRHCSP